MTHTTTLAYLAGIVDGEGYVGIKRGHRKDARSPIFHERIQVRMIYEPAIRLLTETLGGNYYRENMSQRAGGRQLFCWQASDAKACHILNALLPYLRIKRDNALAVLALRVSKNDPLARRRGSPARRPMSDDIIQHRQSLYEACKALNAR